MKRIKLTQGKYALVDDNDFKELSKYKWFSAMKSSGPGDLYYAARKQAGKRIYMHIQIMSTPKGMHTDHLNHDTLDNRRSNLSVVTVSRNILNSRLRKDSTSGVKGVNKNGLNWIARIRVNGKLYNLGTFPDVESAAYARKQAELEFAL